VRKNLSIALTATWSDFKLAVGLLDQIGVDAVVVDAAGGQSHVQSSRGVHLVLQSQRKIVDKKAHKHLLYFDVDHDGEVVANIDFFQVLERELQFLFGLALHEVPLRVVSAPRCVVHGAALQLSTCSHYASR